MKIRASAASDIGCVRDQNEDSFLCDDPPGLYAVADGIGGLPGGAEASRQAVETLRRWFDQRSGDVDPATAVAAANEAVQGLGRRLSPRAGIGTTLTLAHAVRDALCVAHVGDSALFRWRGGRWEALTIEHTVEQEAKRRQAQGESVCLSPGHRAALTRCVGQRRPLAADIARFTLQAGDRYLLCTDGISRGLSPEEAETLVATAATPAAAVDSLIARARQRGGLDNATAVVLFVDS